MRDYLVFLHIFAAAFSGLAFVVGMPNSGLFLGGVSVACMVVWVSLNIN